MLRAWTVEIRWWAVTRAAAMEPLASRMGDRRAHSAQRPALPVAENFLGVGSACSILCRLTANLVGGNADCLSLACLRELGFDDDLDVVGDDGAVGGEAEVGAVEFAAGREADGGPAGVEGGVARCEPL